MEINDRWFSNYQEIKKRHRHPVYSYIGVAIFALIVALILIVPN